MKIIRKVIVLALLAWVAIPLWAQKKGERGQMVIVSSYNPDVNRVSETIYAFSSALINSGLDLDIVVEDMACQNLPECFEWKDRLWGLLGKYYETGKSPAAILLLGTEASSAFFSLDEEVVKKTPVLMSMRGRSIIKLPESDDIDLRTWLPESYDLMTDFSDYNIVGGVLFDYDVKANLDIAKFFYPDRRSLVFLSDNSWGGLTMKSDFKKQMKAFPDYKVDYIDGRDMSFIEVNDSLANIPTDKILIVGTWRIDKTNRFVVKNTTYTFAKNSPGLPMISPSAIGQGYWCLASYSPEFRCTGADVAKQLVEYFKTDKPVKPVLLDNIYTIDYEKLNELKLTADGFPHKFELLHAPIDPWEEYSDIIVWVIVLVMFLSICLGVSLHYLRKSRILSGQLKIHSRQLDIARRNAEEASVMKSNFIANMSHEIRTPLNAVVGFAQLLADPNMEMSPEEKTEFGSIIKMNTDLLLNLVNDSLELSRIDAGHVEFKFLPIDIVELAAMAAESARANLPDGVSIMTESACDELFIMSDKDKLLQVFSNLLNNAKKFTEKGMITVAVGSVYRESVSGENMVEVSVRDTGCGIPKEKAEVVFERFAKVDEFKQGTGLGLAVCRSIVESLGGKIWVDTDYTEGARLVFTHPVTKLTEGSAEEK